MTDTVIPCESLEVTTWASSCFASALTMPVPSPVFGWANTPSGFPIPFVGDRKLPIRSGNIIGNGDLPIFFAFAECMLQRIYDEFGDNQSKTLGGTARSTSCFAYYLQRDWLIVANHRTCEGLAKF